MEGADQKQDGDKPPGRVKWRHGRIVRTKEDLESMFPCQVPQPPQVPYWVQWVVGMIFITGLIILTYILVKK